MKHILFPLLLLAFPAFAQHIEVQPASAGKTTIFSPTVGDTALLITPSKTIQFRPGTGGFKVGAIGSENFRVSSSGVFINSGISEFGLPSTRGGNGQVMTSNGVGGTTWTTPYYLPGGVSGGVAYYDATGSDLQNNASFFKWDNTNKRLGVGIGTPTEALDVVGNGKFSGTLSVTGTSTLAGAVTFNSSTNTYTLPTTRGTNGQVLTSNGTGGVTWVSSLMGITTTNNTALGSSAGTALSTGTENVLVGSSAGSQITVARYNTALGHQAMSQNVNSYANTALGYQALQTLSFTNSGTIYVPGNTAIGYQALQATQPAAASSSGSANTAVGYWSMRLNTTGYENTAVGHSALNSLTTGYQNVAVGENAGSALSTGNGNTFLGRYAGQNSIATVDNIFIGPFSASNVKNASKNIAIGRSALGSLSFLNGGTAWNTYNIAIGEQALGSLNPTTTTDATFNIGIGNGTLSNNSIGSRNIAIGAAAGSNTTGSDNIFIGYQSGFGEAGSNKLYIENSSSATPLIGGDFSANTVTINGAQTVTGTLTLNSSTNTYVFPTTRGTNGQVLTSNGGGTVIWTTPAAADNLGNHTAAQKLDLATFKLVGNGGTQGISISNTGGVTMDNSLNVGTISVGGAVNANAGNFGSGVSTSDYIYMSAQARSKAVSHLHFMPTTATGAIVRQNAGSLGQFMYMSTGTEAAAVVDLPNGCTITSFDVYIDNTSGTGSLKLVKMTTAGVTALGTATIPTGATISSPINTMVSNYVVANATETYALEYDAPATGATAKLYHVVINYTVPRVD